MVSIRVGNSRILFTSTVDGPSSIGRLELPTSVYNFDKAIILGEVVEGISINALLLD